MSTRTLSIFGLFVSAVVFLYPAKSSATDRLVSGKQGMVVSAHPRATEAGIDALKASGNAIDAAVATAFAIAVSEPYGSGLGGGGFAVLWKDGKPYALDFREMAPGAAHREMYLVEGRVDPEKSRTGVMSVGVPGMVQGLWDLHRAHGTLPWKDLLSPAIRLASEGFEVSETLHKHIQDNTKRFNEAARDIFCPGGQALRPGSTLIQKDLANTLRVIAENGAAGFYNGEVAQRIQKSLQEGDYKVTQTDFDNYKTVWRTPVHGEYRGATVFSMPPPSSGGIHLIQMLKIIEGYNFSDFGYGSADSLHLLTEVMKFAFADRSQWLGDPDHYPVPQERLLSDSHLNTFQKRIQMNQAIKSSEIEGAPTPKEGKDTTHLSIVDRHGNAVASTLTINLSFGSAMVAQGTGIILNDEMDDFAAAPGAPNAFGLLGSEANAVAPGKRPLSSMTPTIVTRNNKVLIVAGSPGGSRIITTTLQVILHLLDFEMDIAQAVNAPRIHHQWYPPELFYEPFGVSPDTIHLLEKRGHAMSSSDFMGNAQGVFVDPKSNIRYGASDWRGMGQAAGY